MESIKDVKPLAKTVFPGAHCPLFGFSAFLKGVTDALMIVIGTDECTYYTKVLFRIWQLGGMDGCWCLCIRTNMMLHLKKKLEADRQMYQERKPAIFLVTTCVVEITETMWIRLVCTFRWILVFRLLQYILNISARKVTRKEWNAYWLLVQS